MSQPNSGAGQSAPTGAQSGAGSTADPAVNPPVATTDPAQSGQAPVVTATGETVPKADFDAMVARLSAADQKRDAAEKALKKITDAQLTEAERQAQLVKDTQAENEALKLANQNQAMENAILMDTTYTWANPANVLKLVDRTGITFDKDGKPLGVKAALDALAKSDPHLLKPKDGTGGDDGKSGGTTGATGTTRQHGKGTDISALEKKWPVLRGRVPVNPSS